MNIKKDPYLGVTLLTKAKRIRVLAFILSLGLACSQLSVLSVSAAPVEGIAGELRELSEISFTDVDRPTVGKYLDTKALVRTHENISWEIPVIWIDDLGKVADIARAGRSYIPAFVFFIPDGYTIRGISTDGHFSVVLPDYMVQIFGLNSSVFIMDSASGITYVTFAPIYREQSIGSDAGIVKAPRVYPIGSSAVDGDDDSDNALDQSADDSPVESIQSGGEPADPAAIPEQVRIHCSQGAIDILGVDILEDLVSRVKNKLEPQAVNLLANSFDAYKYASGTELGKKIGLYIYYEEGSVDGYKTPEDALAYVSDRYIGDAYSYYLGIDTKSVMERDPETGEWHYKEDEKDNLSNTIVHEMMHAFMDDYTRYGMSSSDNGFPVWFGEGSASAVENVYQYRAYSFQKLGDIGEDNAFNYDRNRYEKTVKYSPQGIKKAYSESQNEEEEYEYHLTSGCTAGEYVSGYLAYVYLGYLAAMYEGKTDIVKVTDNNNTPDISDDTVSVDIDKIRFGADKILKRLHDNENLDRIIASCSSRVSDDTGETDTGSFYGSTAVFEESFIKGDSEGDVHRQIYNSQNTQVEILGSLAFCTYYLNYLESVSGEGDWKALANGSILKNNMDYCSPLDWNKEEESTLYNIVNTGGYVASTADHDRAYYDTAGRSEVIGSSESTDSQEPKITGIHDVSQDELPIAAKADARCDDTVESTDAAVESTDAAVESTDTAVESTDTAVESTDAAVESTDTTVVSADTADDAEDGGVPEPVDMVDIQTDSEAESSGSDSDDIGDSETA